MADISQVKLPNGDTYNLVDETSGYIKNYTETDPIFSASAAAGITATDITNWNGKSSTDEKVKAVSVTNDGNMRYLIFGGNSGNAETKYYHSGLAYAVTSTNKSNLTIGNTTYKGTLRLMRGGRESYYATIDVGTPTANRTITLPNNTGTIALTSDIPSVYSSTNTGGYLTMATLPIYDGTVV